jgi:hypothetical protein
VATATDAPAVPLLVQSKLQPPTRRELVPRPELVQRLAGGPGRKLTVISAPAGWGKTTLLADWAASEQEKRPFAWLSLDARDAEGARFWTYLMAALRGLQPQLGMAALELLTAPGVDMEREALPVLLNEIETLPQPSVLALDDYHLVDSPQINAGMSYFVEHLPAVCEVAMTTRVEPPLPLARMRVRGELMEIDATQLRFSAAETGELLNDVLQLDLGSGQVDSLCRRTEGWAAGLYLAALSLRQQPDASGFIDDFAGDDRHIVDYLGSEVLAGLGEEVRDFLVRTSILDRLTAPLCDAVTGRKEAARLLPEIERSNLFLIGLDERREWYRYHHLFGELLRRELERSDPDLAPELHRRAAAWFLARGDADGAIRHDRCRRPCGRSRPRRRALDRMAPRARRPRRDRGLARRTARRARPLRCPPRRDADVRRAQHRAGSMASSPGSRLRTRRLRRTPIRSSPSTSPPLTRPSGSLPAIRAGRSRWPRRRSRRATSARSGTRCLSVPALTPGAGGATSGAPWRTSRATCARARSAIRSCP